MKSNVIEIVRVTPHWQVALKQFLLSLESNGDSAYFSPHPYDDKTLDTITSDINKDLHVVLIEGETILGYGLLRGWNEGFAIPSLGIAISPKARGLGLATMLMQFLHTAARRKGATTVRLRVLKQNKKAHSLYLGLGYAFEHDTHNEQLLVGFKSLDDASRK